MGSLIIAHTEIHLAVLEGRDVALSNMLIAEIIRSSVVVDVLVWFASMLDVFDLGTRWVRRWCFSSNLFV